MLKAVIFDLDGTLIDSEPVWDLVFAEIVVQEGKSYESEVHQKFLGKGIQNASQILIEHFGLNVSLDDIISRVVNGFENQVKINPPKEKPGATDLIKKIQAKGLTLAIATGSTKEIAQHIIEACGWSEYFSVLVTGEQVEHGKPAPDIYLETAKRLGIDPKDCLVFEDAPSGVQSAQAAGIKVIGLFDPNFPADLSKADKKIDRFDKITLDELETLANV